MISSISKTRQQDLLEQIGGRELDPPQMHRILPVFGAADADLCGNLFSRICNLQTELSNLPTESRRACSAMLWQLKHASWKLPPNVAVCGLLFEMRLIFRDRIAPVVAEFPPSSDVIVVDFPSDPCDCISSRLLALRH
jgi:hypothetical protein